MERRILIENPYRPGAGHLPPYLAGRLDELRVFRRLMTQQPITENVLITGLRGVGKTVLLEHMRRLADQNDWLWVGNDLSEAAALSEERLALRILTDLSLAIAARLERGQQDGAPEERMLRQRLERLRNNEGEAFAFEALKAQFDRAPGLPSDRLKAVLLKVVDLVRKARLAGLVLAYDEAQCLSDNAAGDQYPMSMLIEVVGALQKIPDQPPCLLILSGLPHVFDALTATRTYSERMFQVMTLDRLSWEDTQAALLTPLSTLMPPLRIGDALLHKTTELTGGYPYLVQFFGRELVEQLLQNGGSLPAEAFPAAETLERLDTGLFAARWNRTTERQREFLGLIAKRPNRTSSDFSATEILQQEGVGAEFGAAAANQMLPALVERGLIYRTRHGRYAFTVPMSETMIMRRLLRERQHDRGWQPPVPPPHAEPPAARSSAPPPPAPARKKRGWFR